ncbi:MAG: hypothetical protein CME16_01620 [Gemmatimonadetes bacterium]|nr:hypothetical protein [Gemmatimonadota bacterium]
MEGPEGQKLTAGLGILEHFTVRDGLPDMKIESIFEDRRGVLWFGTHDRGVVRYEGNDFKSFSRRDGLAGDGVYSIIEDGSENLWFATNQGLTRYDGVEFVAIDPDEESYGFLWGSCRDHEGSLWFGLERRPGYPPALCRWDGGKLDLVDLVDSVREQGQSIHQIVVDPQGELWCGGDGLYRGAAGAFREVEEFSQLPGQIYNLFAFANGALWVCAEDALYIYDSGVVTKVEEAGAYQIQAVVEGCANVIWATTYEGQLLCFSEDGHSLIREMDATCWKGLCLDQVGRLWIGTYGKGLYCYDTMRIQIFQKFQGLPSSLVTCLSSNGSGDLWVGTKNGLVLYDGDSCRPLQGAGALEQSEVTALLFDNKGCLWIGTMAGQLYAYKANQLELVMTITDPEGITITDLAQDSTGKIWFGFRHGTGFGFYEEEEGVKLFRSETGDAYPSKVGALLVDRQGDVWLGSGSPGSWNGLCRYNGSTFAAVDGVSGSSILSMYEDLDGGLWIGTSEGLIYYDGSYFRNFTQANGLPCEIVTTITQIGDGTLWIGTEGGGICCYDGKVFQVIQIPGDPARNVIHQIYQDSGGRIWFATEGGLIQYSPRQVIPEVAILAVVADRTYTSPLEVQFPTTVGRISFSFAGKSPTELSSYLIYRYRLYGHEQEWQQTNQMQVEYLQLEPGEYTFSVQAVDRDLNYSEAVQVKLGVTEDPRIEALNEALQSGGPAKGEFIGESAALKEVKTQIQEVAWTDFTVLVLGETGTGKGLAARAVHELSNRKNKPFIHVNCGALPRELVDSELFGHERGAFTGAVSRRLGRFELADGGTIFLDEIGDLPLESQTRLLRVLQDRCFERVGGAQTIFIDVRVVAATNRDLVEAVREESFRAELYYRLNVFPIQIPPLRKRREDVALLAAYFVRQFAAHLHQIPPMLSSECLHLLRSYDWPGNVRELEHTLQRAVILAKEGEVKAEHIGVGPGILDTAEDQDAPILTLEEYERRYLARILKHTEGVIHGQRGAAVLLGMKPTTLRSRLERLGLKKSAGITS